MSKKTLRSWTHPTSGEVRIYINGTPRDQSKLYLANDGKDAIVYHSINLDGTAKYVRGDLYGKRDKDRNAIREVLAAFGYDDTIPFKTILAAARGETPLVEILRDE